MLKVKNVLKQLSLTRPEATFLNYDINLKNKLNQLIESWDLHKILTNLTRYCRVKSTMNQLSPKLESFVWLHSTFAGSVPKIPSTASHDTRAPAFKMDVELWQVLLPRAILPVSASETDWAKNLENYWLTPIKQSHSHYQMWLFSRVKLEC